jgi:replicative DNA helicase
VTDHARTVLAAVIPNRRDFLNVAMAQLEPEHFQSEVYRNIFILLDRYYNLAGAILPKDALSDLLRRNGADEARVLLYEEGYEDLHQTTVADHEFRYALDALKDVRAEVLTGEAIATAMEILSRGTDIERRHFEGHRDAREFLYAKLTGIDRIGGADQAPEGDMRSDVGDIMDQYAKRKSGKITTGVLSGIPAIDRVTDGFQNGELDLICAYTGEGKSMLSTQIAWHACVKQGKNVYIATSETIRDQVRRRIIARHTREEQFGLPEGIDSNDIKNARLTPEQERKLAEAVEDFKHNPLYGRLQIAQIPRGSTLGMIEAKLSRYNQSTPVDIVIIDYLTLIKPDRHRNSQREEMNDVIKDAKVMATTFADGRGVPVISPWAMNQAKYLEAIRTGGYTLASLAETSEAEKSADMILSLLRLPEQPKEVKTQMLKNRDGSLPAPFTLEADFRTTFLEEKRTAQAVENLLDDMEM